ncbi:MAG: hypothetical protein QXV17_07995 [Candidatus Micrarchaeaceae archaeon]
MSVAREIISIINDATLSGREKIERVLEILNRLGGFAVDLSIMDVGAVVIDVYKDEIRVGLIFRRFGKVLVVVIWEEKVVETWWTHRFP